MLASPTAGLRRCTITAQTSPVNLVPGQRTPIAAKGNSRYEQLADRRGALVNIVGDPAPGLLTGLDEHRCGLDRMPALASRFRVQQRGLVAWTFGLDAVRFTGPGTDLTLVPDATWQISELTGPRGRPNVLNLPTEEIYTTPDWRRASGTVTTTTTTPPLAPGGVLIDRFTLGAFRRAGRGADAGSPRHAGERLRAA